MLPPGVKQKFEDNSNWIVAKLLAYEQIRLIEDVPELPKVKK
jgi:hypothetical protein